MLSMKKNGRTSSFVNNSHFCIVLACSPYFNLSTLAIKPLRFQEGNPL